MPYAYAYLLAKEEAEKVKLESQYNQWKNQMQTYSSNGGGGGGCGGGGGSIGVYGQATPYLNAYSQQQFLASAYQAAAAAYPKQEPNLLLLLEDPS